ncbi:hypothetical protein [Fibrobacter succinogenes]|uniref:hypothetical protein n=1 Tax=Fibrobacter succinogenes TaxID=833 RepID=UPI001568B62D|nr:hypothetical protein [Fibrobacter succinogenes]
MRLMMCMDSWKTRGLNVLIVLLLALTFVACNEDKNEFFDESQLMITVQFDNRVVEKKEEKKSLYKSKKSSWGNKRSCTGFPKKIAYFSTKNSIGDTLNFTPEEKLKNYQKSFKIWSGAYRLKSKKSSSDRSSVNQDTSFLKLNDNFKIPYVGRNLNVGGEEYSASELVETIKVFNEKLLGVIQENMTGPWNSIKLDLTELRKTVKNLTVTEKSQKKMNVNDFFYEIDVKVKKICSECYSKTFDLLNLNENLKEVKLSTYDVLLVDFYPKVKKQKVHFDNHEIESKIEVAVSTKARVYQEGYHFILSSNVMEILVDVLGVTPKNTKNMRLCVKDDYLKILITSEGITDNVVVNSFNQSTEIISIIKGDAKDSVNDYFQNYYLKFNDGLNVLDSIKIPFLNKLFFSVNQKNLSIKSVLESIENYSRLLQFYVDSNLDVKGTGDGGILNLKGVGKMLRLYYDRNIPLRNAAMCNKSFDYLFLPYNKRNFIDLTKPIEKKYRKMKLPENENVLVYRITPALLRYNQIVDFGLLKVQNFTVDFETYVKQAFYIAGDFVIGEDCYLDDVDLKLSARVNEIKLGDKKILFENGRLNYLINMHMIYEGLKNIVMTLPSFLNLDYESLTIMDGDRIVATVNNQNHKERFSYDFNIDKWMIPSSLKPYVTLPKRNMKFDE